MSFWNHRGEKLPYLTAAAQQRELARSPEPWKSGLNWFFKKGHGSSRPNRPGVPSPSQADTGRTD